MRHKGTDTSGSFEAWGLGLFYHYDAQAHILDIIHARRNKPLIYIDFDRSLAKDPLSYVAFIEKSSQIRALMLSNNRMADISETLDEDRLCGILTSVASMARYCFDLQNMRYDRFSKYFIEETELKGFTIEHTSNQEHDSDFFKATLETQKSNTAIGRGPTLFRAISSLSDNIIQDLLTTECGYNIQGRAHALLRISSTLSAFSCILNDYFIPVHKVTGRDKSQQAKSA